MEMNFHIYYLGFNVKSHVNKETGGKYFLGKQINKIKIFR